MATRGVSVGRGGGGGLPTWSRPNLVPVQHQVATPEEARAVGNTSVSAGGSSSGGLPPWGRLKPVPCCSTLQRRRRKPQPAATRACRPVAVVVVGCIPKRRPHPVLCGSTSRGGGESQSWRRREHVGQQQRRWWPAHMEQAGAVWQHPTATAVNVVTCKGPARDSTLVWVNLLTPTTTPSLLYQAGPRRNKTHHQRRPTVATSATVAKP